MKLKSVNRQLRRLQRSVKSLDLDLQAILEEHDRYRLQGTDESILNWFESLPIETLRESLDSEYKKPRTRYSLHDMKHKFALRRLHEKKSAELAQKQSELKVAKIDYILAKIERIQDGENIRGNSGGKKASG